MRAPFVCLLVLSASCTAGQWLQGTIEAPDAFGSSIRLLGTRGTQHPVIDSTTVGPDGRFAFDQPPAWPGFGQLALNDIDRVDLILSPDEPHVIVAFSDIPLQRHVQVIASEENRRLWEHKRMSQRSQALQLEVQADRAAAHPDSLARLSYLDSLEERAIALREGHLMRMIEEAPDSYFAHVVSSTRAMERAVHEGPEAVRSAFDFSDPSLLRSASYAKAIVGYLQSVHASSENDLIAAADSLLAYSAQDTACHRYVLESLIELFAEYGPAAALTHILRVHLDGTDQHLAPRIATIVRRERAVEVGEVGPDLVLPFPGSDTLLLADITSQHELTLLFFYSSTCDHCHAQLAGISWSYRSHAPKGFEVIGIALDADTAEFFATIRTYGITWPCSTELNGWGSEAASRYGVRGTPSMFLLDRQRRIVARPVDALELEAVLRDQLH